MAYGGYVMHGIADIGLKVAVLPLTVLSKTD
jgi:hypothetical protein